MKRGSMFDFLGDLEARSPASSGPACSAAQAHKQKSLRMHTAKLRKRLRFLQRQHAETVVAYADTVTKQDVLGPRQRLVAATTKTCQRLVILQKKKVFSEYKAHSSV